jgi:hypothetical protein
VVLSAFGGTPSTKPLNCKFKICIGLPGGDPGGVWAHHTGDDSKLIFANFTFAPCDITWMSGYCRSLFVPFRLSLMVIRAKKTLLTFGKQGLEILILSLPAYLPIQGFGFLTDVRHGQSRKVATKHTTRVGPVMACPDVGSRQSRPTRG